MKFNYDEGSTVAALVFVSLSMVGLVMGLALIWMKHNPIIETTITLDPTPSPIVAEEVEKVSIYKTMDREWIKKIPNKYKEAVLKYSDEYQVPIKFIYRQIYIESKWNNRAYRKENNGTKSIGLMQLNDKYFEYFVDKYYEGEEPFHPYDGEASLQIGLAYVRDLFLMFDGDWIAVFEAYNCGPTRVRNGNVPEMSKEYAEAIVLGDFDVKVIKGAIRGLE